MFPNDAAAAPRACRCVRCPAGTQSGGGNMTADLCAAPEKTADAAGDVSAQQLGELFGQPRLLLSSCAHKPA